MAGQIYGFNQVFDSNGDPLPGAKLITRVPGTTTPKATYNAPDLLNPLTNPVIADSAGRFPQMWAAEGSIFDLVLTDENDVTIESFESVAALGTSSGDINIDFGLNGRFQVVGHSGEPNIEFGDPTGDDVGGDGRVGGWNNTQGTRLEIDFAETEFTGGLKVGGFSEPYKRLLASGSVNAATLDLPLDGTFQSWELQLRSVTYTAGNYLRIRFSFDGGATYKSGATDYRWGSVSQQNPGGVAGAAGTVNAADTAINLMTGTASNTSIGGQVITEIFSAAGVETQTIGSFSNFSMSTLAENFGGTQYGSTAAKNYGKATNLRVLLQSPGSFVCTYRLYGVP